MGRMPAKTTSRKVTHPRRGPSTTTKFGCPKCTRSFINQTELNRHVQTHALDHERPFPCENCGKRFAQRTAMHTHRNIHTGAQPFECRKGRQACSKKFGDPSSRSRHERETHDPSYGYKCRGNCQGYSVKRRQQFGTHFKACMSRVPTPEDYEDANTYCKDAYLEKVARGEAPSLEELFGEGYDSLPPPPKRKRRGAMASTVITPPESPECTSEDEEDTGRQLSPSHSEHSYLEGPSSGSSSGGPRFYREDSYLDEPAGRSSYNDAYEPAYTPSNYYGSTPLHYPTRDSTSPAHQYRSPQPPVVSSPGYDIDQMNEHMIARVHNRDRMATVESFSPEHSSPEHTHYSMPISHISSSPHIALSSSPHSTISGTQIAMPIPSRPSSLFTQSPIYHPSYIGSAVGVPRSVHMGHEQFQSRENFQRHNAYTHDHRGPSTLYGDLYSTPHTGHDLPVVDNSYGQQHVSHGANSASPLSLAGNHAGTEQARRY